MSNQQEPRELHPYQNLADPNGGMRDFSAHVVPADTPEEIIEAEEVLTPAPKDESAVVPAPLQASDSLIVPPQSGIFVHPSSVIPTTVPGHLAVESESGKPSESSEDEQGTQKTTTPSPETSSRSSSSATNPGKITPPAVAKPPTSAPTPKQ